MTKPRVVLLMLLCAFVGMLLASPTTAQLQVMVFAMLGIALVAASAAVANHVADRHIDNRMDRTQERPVAAGRIQTAEGLLLSAILGSVGFVLLFFFVNPLAAWLNLVSWVGYATFYTIYLKYATPHNIVIGGLFGAAPPLLGWVAITNSIELGAVLLVVIIFLWTPPHFWALALDRKDEYQRAKVPMLPVTHGEHHTRWQILIYVAVLLVVSVLPYAIGMSGVVYLACALILGLVFLALGVALYRQVAVAQPRRVFRYSVIYLALLFASLLGDHYVPAT